MPKHFKYTPKPPLVKGDLLEDGKYQIVSDTRNAGGFGRIYRAKVLSSSNPRRVGLEIALKEFHVHEIDDAIQTRLSSSGFSVTSSQRYVDMLLRQFKVESIVLKKLSSQRDCHIPQLYHSMNEDDGRFYYTMSFISGPTLTNVIKKEGPLDERAAIGYVAQVAKVLYKAHAWNLFHCDVSPNNIMIENGFAVLVDFGNARGYNNLLFQNHSRRDSTYMSIGPRRDSDSQAKYSDIINGMTYGIIPGRIGTPGYSAPDSFVGLPQGDIYSLAATLYYMLTGSKPPVSVSTHSRQKAIDTLVKHNIRRTTIDAIMHAMQPQLDSCTRSARDFLLELPKDIVFDTLLNYNDHDYNRR